MNSKTNRVMAQTDVDELLLHLEGAMELTNMENGVKLVGTALVDRLLNKWGVRNILRSIWKEFSKVELNWVKDNTFIIIVRDEAVATRILNQVPWVVMN